MRMYRASGRIACSMAVVALALGSSAGGQAPSGTSANADWPLHNLDNRNSRYAPLDEINASNVARSGGEVVYDAGAVDSIARNNPLVVDGVMYVDAGSKLFAVDAATGRLIWNVQVDPPFPATGRGPIYGDGKIYAYGQSILYAVDAKTGRIVESFANKGRLEIGRAALQFKYPDKDPTGYQLTASPRTSTAPSTSASRSRSITFRAGWSPRSTARPERSSGCSTPCRKDLTTTAGRSPAVRGAAALGPAAASGRRPRSIPSWDSST